MPEVGQAQPQPAAAEPVRVTSRENSCVTADQFFSLLARHRSTIREAHDTEAAITFNIHFVVEAAVTGELVIVGPDGFRTDRTVVGQSCEEVADALALVGALSMDPLSTQPSPMSETATNAPALPPRTASIALQPPAKPLSTPTRIWIRVAKVQIVNAKTAETPAVRHQGIQQGVSVESFVLAGAAGAPWIGISAKYRLSPGWAGILHAPLRLSLGVSRTLLASQTVSSAAGSADIDYRLTSMEAGICPVGGSLAPTIRLWGCGSSAFGWLQVAQSSPTTTKDDSGPFLGVGLLAQVEVRIAGPLGFVAGLGVSTPLTRYRIQIDSLADAGAVQIGRINGLGSIGLDFGHW